jgi:hypothetical protein
LRDASDSRLFVQSFNPAGRHELNGTSGGMVHTTDPGKQPQVLLEQFYELFRGLAELGVPVTLLEFPRLARDAGYLFGKLQPVFPELRRDRFDDAFAAICRPEWIGRFKEWRRPRPRKRDMLRRLWNTARRHD